MTCHFHVGQKVVLFRAFPSHEILRAAQENVILPTFGVVYTIRNMEPTIGNETEMCLRFNELVNDPHIDDGIEPSFYARLFRPVVERKTDISVFTRMLNTQRVRIDA